MSFNRLIVYPIYKINISYLPLFQHYTTSHNIHSNSLIKLHKSYLKLTHFKNASTQLANKNSRLR